MGKIVALKNGRRQETEREKRRREKLAEDSAFVENHLDCFIRVVQTFRMLRSTVEGAGLVLEMGNIEGHKTKLDYLAPGDFARRDAAENSRIDGPMGVQVLYTTKLCEEGCPPMVSVTIYLYDLCDGKGDSIKFRNDGGDDWLVEISTPDEEDIREETHAFMQSLDVDWQSTERGISSAHDIIRGLFGEDSDLVTDEATAIMILERALAAYLADRSAKLQG